MRSRAAQSSRVRGLGFPSSFPPPDVAPGSRRGSWRCAGRIRGGGRARSCFGSTARASSPLPGRTSVERCLIRHGLVTPQARKRKRSDYKRWERSGRWSCGRWTSSAGSASSTGSEAKIVSGIDDHSRFVVSARVVARATARPVCDALALAMRRHGVPEADLDRQRQGVHRPVRAGPGPVLFDRICRDNGIKHLLTAPRSPTTTGKVERWHKTLRREFLDGKVFDSIDDAQAQLDAWVRALQPRAAAPVDRGVPPIERFQLAAADASSRPKPLTPMTTDGGVGPVTTRRVSAEGHDRVRHRRLQGRRVAGRPDRRGHLRGRAGADPPPRRAHRHPRPPPPDRQADRRRATRPPSRGRHGRRRRRRR